MDQIRPTTDLEVRPLSKDESSLVEEIRLAGNHFFGVQQFRAAELLYRSGLGFMALGPEGMATGCNKCNQKRCIELGIRTACQVLGPEDNRKAATLFLNLAQTLINMSSSPECGIAATIDAATMCFRAEAHLAFVQIQEVFKSGSMPKAGWWESKNPLGRLMVKAVTRNAVALERCANVPGAMVELMKMKGGSAADEEHVARLEAILRQFSTGMWVDAFPAQLWELVCSSAGCHHRARVEIGDFSRRHLDNEVFRQWAAHCKFKAKHQIGVFSCGPAEEGTLFVARYSGGDVDGRDAYLVLKSWREGARVRTEFWGAFMGNQEVPYHTGAVIDNVLYCLSVTDQPEMLMVCYPLAANGKAPLGTCASLPVEWRDSYPLRRSNMCKNAANRLVACSGKLYLFGGMEVSDSGRDQACSDMLEFVPQLNKGEVRRVSCRRLPTDQPPSPRWGHATFARDHEIFVFGGTDGSMIGNGQQSVFSDMYALDVKTRKWRIVEPVGSKPCARSSHGVASDGQRVVIVGGWANARPGVQREPFWWLADVWEYHFAQNCWIQVVPEDRHQPWIAGRQSAACGLLGNTLVTLGGYGPGGAAPIETCASFTWLPRGPALALHAKLAKQSVWRDLAVENALSTTAEHRPDFIVCHDKAKQLFQAPAGAVTIHTISLPDIVDGVYAPEDAEYFAKYFSTVAPLDCSFSPKLEVPIRPLNSKSLWGSQECPFDLAPRWLTPPCEISTNMVSSSSQHSRVFGFRQTVKHFGTVKAAVEYFRLCQPQLEGSDASRHLEMWHLLKNASFIAEKIDIKSAKSPCSVWNMELKEFSCYYCYDISADVLQLYQFMVFGPVFACILTRHAQSVRTSKPGLFAYSSCFELANMQLCLIDNPEFSPRLPCCHCGLEYPYPDDLEMDPETPTTKVCKGCHLVRYCSPECQLAAWPAHRAICRKHSAPRRNIARQRR